MIEKWGVFFLAIAFSIFVASEELMAYAKQCKAPVFVDVDESSACRVQENSLGMHFVKLQGGTFTMGSLKESDEQPVHEVTIGPFYLGVHEVTQGQWYKVMGSNPSIFTSEKIGGNSLNHPVEQVSWKEVQMFIRKLNKLEGDRKYRLPSEAEWEYAVRAGNAGVYGGGIYSLEEHAWYSKNAEGTTHVVGSKMPNNWGLHDMHGNVWEWVEDCWHDHYQGAPNDGSAWVSGSCSYRVLRGAFWLSEAVYLRSTLRTGGIPKGDIGTYGVGLRLAHDL